MVGVQCKSCGHRALATPDPFKPDHEIITLPSQSTPTCIQCGGSKYDVVRFSSAMGDVWLKGSAPMPSPKPLIEGGSQS